VNATDIRIRDGTLAWAPEYKASHKVSHKQSKRVRQLA
jgi:hypothetical protein